MKIIMFYTLLSLFAARAVEVEVAESLDWQKEILKKVEIDVEVRTLAEIMGEHPSVSSDSIFLVFTARSKEILEKRLLWVDFEVTFSDGKVRTFNKISFDFQGDGIECDVRKYSEISSSLMDTEKLGKDEKLDRIKVRKLTIIDAVFK